MSKRSSLLYLSQLPVATSTSATMSESPASDPEKHAYPSDTKPVYSDATPVDQALGESEIIEFEETHELK
jgi:hypothetical protein